MPTLGSSAYSVIPCMPHGSELVNEQLKGCEGWGRKLRKEPQTERAPALTAKERRMEKTHPRLSSESKGTAELKNATWEDLKPHRGGWEEGSHCS